MRVALFGNFGTANLGNEGSLEAFVQLLGRIAPTAAVSGICIDAESVTAQHGLPAIRITPPDTARVRNFVLRSASRLRDLKRAHALVADYDLIVVPGTGLLDDFGDRPFGMPWYCFMWALAAHRRKVPFWLVSIGAGPIRHPLSRQLMVAAARLASMRSHRDQGSHAFLREAGVDVGEDLVTPDLAFCVEPPAAQPTAADRPTIGIGVMEYRGWQGDDARLYAEVCAKLGECAARQLRAGRRVRLLIGERTTDEDAVARVLSYLRSHAPEHLAHVSYAPARSLGEVMQQLADVDVLVASRFHNVVCALKLGVPTVSLGYADKNALLLRDVGLGAYAGELAHSGLPWLCERIEHALAHREPLSHAIRTRVKQYERALAEQEEQLARRLPGGGSSRAPSRPPELQLGPSSPPAF